MNASGFRKTIYPLVFLLALTLGCKSPAKNSTEAAPRAPTPPPLAVETFQAAWEMIRDTHWDTNFNGHNWEQVRADFLPRVQSAKTQDEARDAMQSMLDLLGHSHLMIIPGTPPRPPQNAKLNLEIKSDASPGAAPKSSPKEDRGGNGSLGIEVRSLDGKIVVFRVERASPAEKAGLRPGWILLEIDGEPAAEPLSTEIPKRQCEFMLWHNAADLLKGGIGEPCELLVDTGSGNPKKISIPRAAEAGEPAKLGNLPTLYTRVETNQLKTVSGNRIGYLRFNIWMLPAIQPINEFIDRNRNSDAIIIDLRGNVGGIGGMVMGTAGHFVNQRVSLGKMTLRDNQLNFIAFPRRVDLQMHPTNTFQGKLAILTDAISLSSAELFAGGLQELGRARVFGEQTGGQALPAVSDRLPNGDLLYHAIADFNTPQGRRLEGEGVIPDELVPLRLEALRAGKDEPLEAALRWMDSPPQARPGGVR